MNNPTVSQTIGGAGSLTQSGSGTLVLSGNNTYSGSTTVSAGELQVASSRALGSTAGATTVQIGATLGFKTNYTALEQVFLNGGTIQADANVRFAGPITLEALDSFFSALPGATLTLAGVITEQTAGSGVQINPGTSTGTVVLTTADTYTGLTELVHGGLLVNGTVNGEVQTDSSSPWGATAPSTATSPSATARPFPPGRRPALPASSRLEEISTSAAAPSWPT